MEQDTRDFRDVAREMSAKQRRPLIDCMRELAASDPELHERSKRKWAADAYRARNPQACMFETSDSTPEMEAPTENFIDRYRRIAKETGRPRSVVMTELMHSEPDLYKAYRASLGLRV